MRIPTAGRALAVAFAAAVAALTAPAGAASPAAAAVHIPAGGPGRGAGYHQPHPGNWQRYVVAPATRKLQPRAVISADPRGGSIQGDPSAVLRPGGTPVRLVSKGDRTISPLLTVDFGQDVGGYISVHVAGASRPRPHLHVCFSESRRYMALAQGQNNGETAYAPGCDTANFPNGYPGIPYTWDSDSHQLPLANAALPGTLTDPQLRGGFRYATIFLDGPGWVSLDGLSLHFAAAPGQPDLRAYRGHFLSSDSVLNKIWYAAAYTVQLDTAAADTLKSNISAAPGNACWPYHPGEADHADNTMPYANPAGEVILDGGKRDRDAFTGDLSVEDPVTLLSTDDTGAVTNTLQALARQQLPDGFVPGNGRVCPDRSEYFSGTYDLQFVRDMYQYYWYTGDQGFLRRWYPTVARAMAWVAPQVDSSGLLSFAGYGSQGACGTYAYGSCDHLTYANALYILTLRETAVLARDAGDSSGARDYTSEADRIAAAINRTLWDPAAGAYRMSPAHPDVHPQDANAMAVLAGVASPARAASAMAYLQAHTWSTYGSLTAPPGTSASAFPSHYEPLPTGYEVAARLAAGSPQLARTALQLTRRFWGYQLSQGPGTTLWEKLNPDGAPGIGAFTSLAHGWAAGPVIALTTRVLGITPSAPGFAAYTIAPHPGGLSWAEGTVPTPRGDITARWISGPDGAFRETTSAPGGDHGTLAVPAPNSPVTVFLDGHLVWNGHRALAPGVHAVGGYIYIGGIGPGTHRFSATKA